MGYPVFYFNPMSCAANCAECMQKDIDNEYVNPEHCGATINWESEMYCDECSVQIESAYDPQDGILQGIARLNH